VPQDHALPSGDSHLYRLQRPNIRAVDPGGVFGIRRYLNLERCGGILRPPQATTVDVERAGRLAPTAVHGLPFPLHLVDRHLLVEQFDQEARVIFHAADLVLEKLAVEVLHLGLDTDHVAAPALLLGPLRFDDLILYGVLALGHGAIGRLHVWYGN